MNAGAASCSLVLCLTACAQTTPPPIPANDLRAEVSFLASDALEGRATPSKGLDIAAEYIASEFRRYNLEPAGDDGYFQTAAFHRVIPNLEGLELRLTIGGRNFPVDPKAITVSQAAAADLDNAPLQWGGVLNGRITLLQTPKPPGAPAGWAPALTISVSDPAPRRTAIRPDAGPTGLSDASIPRPSAPVLSVRDAALRKALTDAPEAAITVTAHIPPPTIEPVKLRNVAAILRGSDPAVKDTYLLLTAHYDHLGVRASGAGDRIFNGANDDASGTASLIQIARALAALPSGPRRSVVFIATFGEELGEIGSLYYVHHPLFPLARTIADINLEQLGRTDDSEGPKAGQFNLTGFDYTTLAATFRQAAEAAGVKAISDPSGDSYFARSDNARFADAGIPDTTVSVSYMFPDYHAVGDEWPKIDYENMAKVDSALALAAEDLANAESPPQWNAKDPRTERYVKAHEALEAR